MSYFPMFIDLEDKNCLIIGGGKVSLRKTKTLLDYGAKITVVSPKVLKDFKVLDITIRYREFEIKDLIDVFLVVTATNNAKLNQQILEICKSRNILCNSTTNTFDNGYIFSSIAKYEDIIIGISTSGKSPYVSSLIKSEIEKEIVPKYSRIVKLSSDWRNHLIHEFEDYNTRSKIIKHLIDYTIKEGEPSKEKIQQIINEYR